MWLQALWFKRVGESHIELLWWVSLAGYQAPTKLLYHCPFSSGQERENQMENNSQVKIKQFTKAVTFAKVASWEAGIGYMQLLLWKRSTNGE